MYIERYMTRNPVAVRPETPLPDVRDLLRSRSFRHLPVTDASGRLLGMVSDGDIRSAFPSTVLDPVMQQGQIDSLEQVPVSSIMSRRPLLLPLAATLDDALLIFSREPISALPVVDAEGRVVGIFSARDLMRAYRQIFGIGEAGAALVEVEDDGKPRLLARIAGALEERDITCTRLVRLEGAGDIAGTVYVRVQTINLRMVHEALAAAGLATVQHKPAP